MGTSDHKELIVLAGSLREPGMNVLKKRDEILVVEPSSLEADPHREQEFRRASALVVRLAHVSRKVLDRFPNIRVIGRHGAGLDNIDVGSASERGIPVVFVPDAMSVSVAEHAVALMLAMCKSLMEYDQHTRQGRFSERDTYRGIEVGGKTLGLVGFGRIGRAVARICLDGLGMRVAAWDPLIPQDDFARFRVERFEELGQLLSAADIVSIHVPLDERTRHLIGYRELSVFKRGAILINVSRGPIVDEAALYEALTSGLLGGAGLDVFEKEPPDPGNPLFSLRNVIVSPHIAGMTSEAADRMSLSVAEDVVRVLDGQMPRNMANPEIWDRRRM